MYNIRVKEDTEYLFYCFFLVVLFCYFVGCVIVFIIVVIKLNNKIFSKVYFFLK